MKFSDLVDPCFLFRFFNLVNLFSTDEYVLLVNPKCLVRLTDQVSLLFLFHFVHDYFSMVEFLC
jgi:hypothetical protein